MERRVEQAREVVSDEDLERNGRLKNHRRRERIFDALATVLEYGVYAVTAFFILWVVALSIHYIVKGDWETFRAFGRDIFKYVAVYVAGWISKMGLSNDK